MISFTLIQALSTGCEQLRGGENFNIKEAISNQDNHQLFCAFEQYSTADWKMGYLKMVIDHQQGGDATNYILSLDNEKGSLEFTNVLKGLAIQHNTEDFIKYGQYDTQDAVDALQSLRGSKKIEQNYLNFLILSYAKEEPSTAKELLSKVYHSDNQEYHGNNKYKSDYRKKAEYHD